MDLTRPKSELSAVQKRTSPLPAQFCMCCLETECKLYLLRKYNLYDAYENLTGKSLRNNVHFMPRFCAECVQRLINCNKFRDKSLKAHNLIMKLVEKPESLTMPNVKRMKLSNNQLKSHLTKKIFEPNHCDYSYLMHNQREIKIEFKIDNNPILKTKNTDDYPDVFKVEPKVEDFNDMKSDEEYLNDSLDNEMEFIHSEHDGRKVTGGIKSDGLINDEFEEVEFLCDSDWELPKDSDSEVEILYVENQSGDARNAVTKSVSKRKASSSSNRPRNVRRRTKAATDEFTNNPSIQDDLRVFTITPLTYEEQVEQLRRKKDSDSYRGSAYKCAKCYKGLGSLSTYQSHMKRHSQKYGNCPCPVCKLYFESNKKLRHHLVEYHNMRYSCNSCAFVTSHKKSAVNHGRWHRGFTFKCPHCEEEYSKKSSYLSHLRLRHPSDVVCRLCGFFFINERGLKVHTNLRHRNDKFDKLDGPLCEPCNIRFASNNAYQQHLTVSPRHIISRFLGQGNQTSENSPQETEVENDLIECEQCGIQLEGAGMYSSHCQRYHPEKKQVQVPQLFGKAVLCEQCGKSFHDPISLRDHVLSNHSVAKYFQCDICNKKYSLRTNLIVHMRVHTGLNTTFACPLCGKKFPNKANTQRHILTHSETKPYKCVECEKTFVSASAQRCHVRHTHLKEPWPKRNRGPKVRASRPRHTKEVDPISLRDHVLSNHSVAKYFQCDICNKKYSLRTNLIVHMRVHTGLNTTFACPLCGKKFPNKANTQRHILTHSETKPYKCVECEKTFVSASAQRCHVRHTHLKEPWPKRNRGPKVRASRPRHTKEVVSGDSMLLATMH